MNSNPVDTTTTTAHISGPHPHPDGGRLRPGQGDAAGGTAGLPPDLGAQRGTPVDMSAGDGGMLRRLFAWWYPKLMGLSERAGQADVRRAQLKAATGRTLEIGVGSGLSLPHYGDGVTELVLLEPNTAFHPQLRSTIEGLEEPPWSWRLVTGDGHHMPFDDSTFDTVTASFTFCSVVDPSRVLDEIHRVLRPGGRFLFHEHVRGKGARARLQDALEPLQVALADGCHPNRDFLGSVAASPLQTVHVVSGTMPRGFPTVATVVHGTAVRPIG